MNINRFVVAILALFTGIGAHSEKTLLTPGKSWIVAQNRNALGCTMEVLANISVEKDTTINSIEMTKLNRHFLGRPDEVDCFYVREDNGKFYDNDDNLVMDFNLREGADFASYPYFEPNHFKITQENTIEVNGRKFRELVVGFYNTQPIDSWVEGVGCCFNVGTIYPQIEPTAFNRIGHSRIVCCSENGKIIFTENDFSVKPKPVSALKSIMETGKWWTLEVTMPDSSIVDARAEVVNTETINNRDYATISLVLGNGITKEFTIYTYNHRLFVKDKIDYPIIDEATTPTAQYGRYKFNERRDKLEQTTEKFCGLQAITARGQDNIFRLELHIACGIAGVTLDPQTTSWVEGVGLSKSLWITENGPQTIAGYRMKECGKGNEVLFNSCDFYYTPSAIYEIKATPSADAYYDLQGRKITMPRPGQFFINHGHLYRQGL